jgi:hypothetical protein
MPIQWDTASAPDAVGQELHELMRELFPIRRSLTGDGVRETLAVLARDVPLEVIETPTGTPIFDWTVPREWNVREAWIEAPDGDRVLDLADSPLHVLGYSAPVDAVVPLAELREHVFTHPDDPDLVPYRTSYWEEQWGFCMTRRRLDALPEGDYRVRIGSTLQDGSLTSGELTIPGETEKEFLVSTYLCHPALANDNLSGVVLLWALARTLQEQPLRHTFRLVWGPGTLGPLCWLARNRDGLERIPFSVRDAWRSDPALQAQLPRSIWRAYLLDRDQASFRLATGRRRRATAAARLRPPGRNPLADAARALSRVPLVGRRPRSRLRRVARRIVPGRAGADRPRRDERPLPEPLAVRRTAAGSARPLPERSGRDEPGGCLPLAAQPLRRLPRPARDRRTLRAALRGGSRCGRDARAAELPERLP